MRLSTLVILAFAQVQANIYYQFSGVYLDASGNQFYKMFPNCVDFTELEVNLYLRAENADYFIDQRYMQTYISASVTNITITNTTTFNVPPSDAIFLSTFLAFKCRDSTTVDYAMLRTEDINNFDGTWPNNITRNLQMNSQIVLFNRSCDVPSNLGLKCDQQCVPTYNEWYCYGCDKSGYRECCHYDLINSQNCGWTNATNLTTTTVEPCRVIVEDNGKQDLFMWLMIGFAILSGILILLLLFCLFLMCMKNNERRQSVAPVYVRPIRSDEVIQSRQPSQRRSRSRGEAPPYSSYRNNPSRRQYVENTRGSFQMEYDLDDDSLREDWVEPMPRRVAKQTPLRRRSSPREPRDVVV